MRGKFYSKFAHYIHKVTMIKIRKPETCTVQIKKKYISLKMTGVLWDHISPQRVNKENWTNITEMEHKNRRKCIKDKYVDFYLQILTPYWGILKKKRILPVKAKIHYKKSMLFIIMS